MLLGSGVKSSFASGASNTLTMVPDLVTRCEKLVMWCLVTSRKENMPRFDLSTQKGVQGAYEYRQKLYDLLMTKTPKERHDFLEERGWVLVSKKITPIDSYVLRKVEKIWKTPERGTKAGYLSEFCQTRAIGLQLWWNMEDAGVTFASDPETKCQLSA